MNSEHHDQRLRLQQYRHRLLLNEQNNGPQGDARSGAQVATHGLVMKKSTFGTSIESQPVNDPLIYPGLYAPSGIDMMGILVRVRTRPNPIVDIGNIDSSVALVLCDTAVPDMPIVYCSEPFETLFGYSSAEILGRNCRFLQHPNRGPDLAPQESTMGADHTANLANQKARTELRESLARGVEAQVQLVNFTKSGRKFFNLLTTIPIKWDDGDQALGLERRYVVGFQAEDRNW